jgi:cytochrome P450
LTQTAVGIPQWASYQSERNFRNHGQFVPERWLGDPDYAHDVREVLQPFSVGPRNCIGKKYAYNPSLSRVN